MNDNGKRMRGGSAPKKKRKFGWPQYILLCIVFELVQEIIAAHTGWLLWPNLSKWWVVAFHFFSVVFSGCFSVFADKKKGVFFKTIICPNGMTFWEHFFVLVKEFFGRYIRHNTLIFAVVIIVVLLYVPAFAADKQVARQVFNVTQQVIDVALPPETSPNGGADGDDAADNYAVGSLQPSVEAEGDDALEAMAANSLQEDAEKPLGSLAERLVLSREIDYTISNEELGRVFFMDGDYCIEDWDNEEAIWPVIQEFVQDQQKLRRNPGFAADVSQPVLDQIAYASQLEYELLSEMRPTAKKLSQVIDLRVESYDSSPSYRLAVLTRESFCSYADACWEQACYGDAAAILYEKSIIWNFETLQYDVRMETFQENLQLLSERYAKLAQVLEPDSNICQYASKLAEMFQELSQEY